MDAAVFSDDSDHQEFVVPNLEAEDERSSQKRDLLGWMWVVMGREMTTMMNQRRRMERRTKN